MNLQKLENLTRKISGYYAMREMEVDKMRCNSVLGDFIKLVYDT